MNRRNPRLVVDASSSTSNSSKKLRSSSDDDDDRISDLSDNVLHHILSFLNMEQAIQTSVLSRRWRFLWSSLPFLKFDMDLYISHKRKNSYSFNVFVDQVLLQRDNSNIQRLNLACSSENHLNAWILYALRFNVQELRLLVKLDGGLFRLPHRLFTCTSLTVLALSHWSSLSCAKLSLPDSISLPLLKSLHFQFISFEGDDDSINKLFSSCPLLEVLFIRNCEFRRNNLKILSPRLRHLKIEKYIDNNFKGSADGSVILYAPCLVSFICKDFASKNYSPGDLPSLVKADIEMGIEEKECPAELKEKCVQHMMKFMRAVQNVKDLTLSGSVLQILSRAHVLQESSSSKLCNLRCLKLVTRLSPASIRGITYMLMMCPNIETLSLLNYTQNYLHVDLKVPLVDQISFDSANIGDDSEGELSSEWSLHHLKCVEFRRVVGWVNELKFLQVVLKRSLVLEKLLIAAHESIPFKEKLLTMFRENLLTFPIASPRIAIVLV